MYMYIYEMYGHNIYPTFSIYFHNSIFIIIYFILIVLSTATVYITIYSRRTIKKILVSYYIGALLCYTIVSVDIFVFCGCPRYITVQCRRHYMDPIYLIICIVTSTINLFVVIFNGIFKYCNEYKIFSFLYR